MAVALAGRLIIVPSWLQLIGSSVLCLEEVVKGCQTSCTQQLCLTHLQRECVHVCVALEGKVKPFLCKQSHHTGQNTFLPPPRLQFVRWPDVGNSGGWGGWQRSRRCFWIQMKENLFHINMTSYYTRYRDFSFCAGLVKRFGL